MANYSGGGSAICPFYEHESQYSITCEGLVCGAATQIKFESKADKTAFVADSCSSFDYQQLCPLAGLLTARYEEDSSLYASDSLPAAQENGCRHEMPPGGKPPTPFSQIE